MINKSIKHIALAFCSVCCGFVAIVALTSCEDYLTIYPTDKTTGKDYWKTKAHVNEMVAGAYKQMSSDNTEARVMLWGLFRSDDVVKAENYKGNVGNNMEYVSAVNLYPTQDFCKWDPFYAVINRCNQVLAHAPEVLQLDPEFTEGDYEVARGQMLALRSLAYFYLVRAFRDVPYVDQAFEGDEQVAEVAQSTPYDVLQHCIDDLEEAAGLVMHTGAYTVDPNYPDWRDFGYITQDACWAILADIYLWRASMTHNQADYQKVVDYAEMVINSKDSYYHRNFNDRLSQMDPTDRYHLYTWTGMNSYNNPNAHNALFVKGNSRESILEFQYNENDANGILAAYLFRDGNASSYSRFMASQVYNNLSKEGANTDFATKAFFSVDDYRYWAYLYDVNDENAMEQHIRKYATMDGDLPRSMTISGHGDEWKNNNMRSANNFDVNWIVYRLTDIMLLEAEARVQLATADDVDDPQLRQAFNLVQVVNKRSMKEKSKDTLDIAKFPSRSEMELLVLSERQRELCFESKRWFDLLRFSYRHMEGVDAHSLMADHTEWPALHKPMVSLAARSYTSGGDIFNLKMKSEPFLYWPINEDEIKVNKLLKQNPVFIQTDKSERK